MRKTAIIIVIVSLLTCCKKDVNYILHGNVKHKFTHQNISGMYIMLFDRITPIKSLGTNSNPMLDTYTDNNGNYNFNFDIKENNSSKSQQEFTIMAGHKYPYDSTSNAFKYYFASIDIQNNEINNNHDFLLTPSGNIIMFVSDSTWNYINADSIIIQSPYETKYIIRNVTSNNQISFDVDPSIESTFSWCHIENGIQSTLIMKNIFVPNWWTYFFNGTTSTSFKYEIKF